MNELERALVGDSYAASPEHILDGLGDEAAHRSVEGTPHTIYAELWHVAFWQQISLDWIDGVETPFPERPSAGFPAQTDREQESWDQLCRRFFDGNRKAAAVVQNAERLGHLIRCPSRPGSPVRTMTVQEQLESLAAHNAYHLGRIVLLRQLGGVWPPPSGGYSW